MPWKPGQSGNPSGARPEILEFKEVRRLAQERTVEAFEVVVALMKDAEKDAVRLAAALAILKIAGVRMDGSDAGGSGPPLLPPDREPIEVVRTRVLTAVRNGA